MYHIPNLKSLNLKHYLCPKQQGIPMGLALSGFFVIFSDGIEDMR